MKQPTCAERIEEHQASREATYAMLNYGDEHPEVWDEDSVAYIDHAINELGYTLDNHDKPVVEEYRRRFERGENVDLGPEFGVYEGYDLEEAITGIMETIASATRDDREQAFDEMPLAVDATVTVTLRVDLSTGGPADYLTAEMDPEDRSLSDVKYHFADWYDHAATSVTDGPLLHMMQRYAELVSLPSLGDDR